MALFTKHESFLGVDIGSGGMKLVEIRQTKKRPQLWTYGIADATLDIHPPHDKTPEELLHGEQKEGQDIVPSIIDLSDPRIDQYAALLKQLVEKARVTTKRVTASLPVSHIFHAIITLPTVDAKEMDHHVQAKVKKMLPRPIEEMQVVHQVIPPKDPKQKQTSLQVLVTAAPRDLVAFYTAIFQKAGLQLEELETEAFALERSLVGRDTSTMMVVDIGAERSNFFIMDQGLPITHRSLQVGGEDIDTIIASTLGVPAEDVWQVKRDIGLLAPEDIPTDLFLSVVDPIAKEIKYGFDLFLAQSGNEGKRPEKIILTGGSSLFPAIQTYLEQMFQIKVFVGDPWARVVYQDGLRPVLDAVGPRMSVAIGLALRNLV